MLGVWQFNDKSVQKNIDRLYLSGVNEVIQFFIRKSHKKFTNLS